jgi:ketosteroid isomerase-like protein
MLRIATRTFVALLLTTLAPVAAPAQVIPGAPRTDWERERHEYTAEVLRAYNEVIANWREVWLRGDANATADHYSARAILLIGDSLPLEGRPAIQQYLQRVVPRTIEIRTGLSDFVASERLAYAMGPFYFVVREADGGTQDVLTGTAVTILVREGRNWRIRSQILRPQAGENQ